MKMKKEYHALVFIKENDRDENPVSIELYIKAQNKKEALQKVKKVLLKQSRIDINEIPDGDK